MSDFVIDHRPDGTPVFIDREEHYLMHHGIPGQKWGKRNGPPYPLDEKDYSREERRLAKQDLRSIKRNVKKTGSLFRTYSYAANTNAGIKVSNSESVYKAKMNFVRIANRESEFDDLDDRTKEFYRKDAIKKAIQGDKDALSIFGYGIHDSYDSEIFDNFIKTHEKMSIDDKIKGLSKTDFLHIREESGHYASFQSYLRDKYKQTYAEHLKQIGDSYSDYEKAIEDEVSSILKEYGDTVVSDKERSETLSKIISKGIFYSQS